MTYTAISTPLPLGMYLCEINDSAGDLVLTLTTEVVASAVAVYHHEIIERRDVDCLTNTHDVMINFHAIIDRIDLPDDLREFAKGQLRKEYWRRVLSDDPFFLNLYHETERNKNAGPDAPP